MGALWFQLTGGQDLALAGQHNYNPQKGRCLELSAPGSEYCEKHKDIYPKFCADDEFIEYLSNSAGAIVEPSTAALVPMLMGKPIFLTQYDALQGLDFGSIISLYPKAFTIVNDRDFYKICGPINFDYEEAKNWISHVSGPLPASLMPSRVVKTLLLALE